MQDFKGAPEKFVKRNQARKEQEERWAKRWNEKYGQTHTRLQAEINVLVEDLIVENRLLTETINYIFQNHLLSNEQIEEIKDLIGKRCIQQLADGTYCW